MVQLLILLSLYLFRHLLINYFIMISFRVISAPIAHSLLGSELNKYKLVKMIALQMRRDFSK